MSKTDLQARIAALPPEKRAALLAKLREQEGRQGRAAQDDIPTVARDGEHHELSFAQQRLWFLQQFDTSSAEYNIPMGYRLLGPVDPHRLRQALVLLLERHESLRTTFITVDGEPRQVIHDTVDIRLPVVDLRPRDEDRREHDARFEMSVDAKTPFDLEKGPLLRGVLFQLDDREFLLYLNIHHVTFDGWSNGVLIRELMALYGALERDEDPATALPEMAIQYLDFAAWQRQHLAGDRMKRQIDYWKQRIEGTPPLELAPDRPRPAVRTYHGTTYPIDFGPEVSAQLEQLARDEDCTLFVTLMTAYRALLHRYTHQDDFAIGTLVANRTRSELEGLIGFFANTLAMRTPLTHETTFRELMRAEKETAFAAYDHQDVPFEKVVEELKPERDLARTPYFQVMMLLQNAPSQRQETAEEADPDAVRLGTFGVDSATSKFELTLYLTQGEQVSGFFEYNTDLFDRDTIARMAGHLRILVEGAVADPDRPLHAYPLMDDSERRMIVDAWNRTAVEFPREALVHEEFEARVDATPDKVALIAGEVRLTYRELDQRANRLAHHLLALGTEPEQFVGVCTDRSEHMVIALLAVMKAGCAYLPMDPDYPNDRLGYMLEDTAAPVILTLKSLVGKLPESTARVVVLDGDGEDALAIVQRDDARPALRNSAMNLAYVIHTSGSTGKPKGVPIPHRAVVNFLRTMAETPGLTADDTLLAVTTISFDIAGLELYLPLTVGSTLVLADRDTASAGEQLMKLLDTCGANVMQATPATWQLLYGAGWKGDPDLKVLCGGEALPPELAERLLRTCRTAWNVYGPTEATIWSTVHTVEADDGKAGAVPIGKPIANTQIYLVDRHFQPVPVGVPGELLIGGDGLARGYLNRPELAGDRFVPLPFPVDATAGERVYRTGDLVRWLPDGKLSFIGRIDHQVKVRGYRIELGEIEAVLDSHPAIERAVVIVREDQPGTVRLVGYMVAHPKDSAEHQPLPKPGDLKEFLKTKLPEYMVPAIFVPLDPMPLTPNGKVNRRALPKPDPTLFRTTEYVPPETDDEKAMAAIWAEVLGVKDVGLDDDFFDLGGDSLLVIRVVAKAKKADLVITTKQVFQNKTLRELVKVIGTT
ncbi:MAG: amino acid adenylation domain-containing protein, partial [Acidobacteriota bacterium]